MMNCDLIITSDTATAHLAGALGRLLGYYKKIPDWRWMLEQKSKSLVSKHEVISQKELGDWDHVFKIMKKDLVRLLNN